MWIYEKTLQAPVRAKGPNVALAKLIVCQYGGPDGELSASLRYLNQRYSMPFRQAKALLTDIGTEELAHMEMIATMVHKLTEGASPESYEKAGWGAQYAQHQHGLFWTDDNGVPWSACYIGTLGDPIADLVEDLAAEQKARVTYEHLIQLSCDPMVNETLRYLWEREVVHCQRFGEMLDTVQCYMQEKNHTWCGTEFNECKPKMDMCEPKSKIDMCEPKGKMDMYESKYKKDMMYESKYKNDVCEPTCNDMMYESKYKNDMMCEPTCKDMMYESKYKNDMCEPKCNDMMYDSKYKNTMSEPKFKNDTCDVKKTGSYVKDYYKSGGYKSKMRSKKTD